MTQFNPYLNFAGNTETAFNFYKSVFGGEFSAMVRFRDLPIPGVTLSAEDANKIMHVGLPIGANQMLMASDVLESLGHKLVSGNNIHISVHPDSKAEADRLFTALAEGGKIEMPLADQPWGDYYGNLQDRFGVYWMINYHQE